MSPQYHSGFRLLMTISPCYSISSCNFCCCSIWIWNRACTRNLCVCAYFQLCSCSIGPTVSFCCLNCRFSASLLTSYSLLCLQRISIMSYASNLLFILCIISVSLSLHLSLSETTPIHFIDLTTLYCLCTVYPKCLWFIQLMMFLIYDYFIPQY